MKSISFQPESALLFDREKDTAEAEALGIKPIDMVVIKCLEPVQVNQTGKIQFTCAGKNCCQSSRLRKQHG